jgi:hypothetical protein
MYKSELKGNVAQGCYAKGTPVGSCARSASTILAVKGGSTECEPPVGIDGFKIRGWMLNAAIAMEPSAELRAHKLPPWRRLGCAPPPPVNEFEPGPTRCFLHPSFPSAACAAVQCALKYGFQASHRFFLIVLLVRLAGLTHTRT